MAKITLTNGQNIVTLDYSGDQYLNNTAANVGSAFSLHGLPVTPVVDECASDANQTIEVSATTITDNNGNSYLFIVGKRPKKRPR